MILTIESIDNSEELFKMDYEAKKEMEKLGIKFSYCEEETEVSLYMLKEKIIMQKKGAINSYLVLDPNKKTNFKYESSMFSGEFTVETKKLKALANSWEIRYAIYDNVGLVNEINMNIKEGRAN